MQSGIASVVGNATLYGILSEALNYESIEEIYGCYNGFEGLQQGNFLDLAALPQKSARMLLHTAGFALRSEGAAFDSTHCDYARMLQNLQEKGVHLMCCICDSSTLPLVNLFLEAARKANYDLQVIAIPQSNTNELPLSDHSLGYGSYLKCLNAHILEFNQWLRNSGEKVGIYEVSGGSNGWLAAGVALGSAAANKSGSMEKNPFLVCLPEQPLNESLLTELIQEKINACGYACVVTNHQLVNDEGEFLDLCAYNYSMAQYLDACIQDKLGFSSRINFCPLHLQALSHFISKQDQTEAIESGRTAVRQLMDGDGDAKALVLVRKDSDHYDFGVDLVDWSELLTGLKFFPTDWTSDAMCINYPFVKYALPLIQGEVDVCYEKGLPQLVQL